jgi:hypothetical protein
VYKLMERLPVATANSPKHGQPGQTLGEDGVKTPWAWAVNTPAGMREKNKKHVEEGRLKKPHIKHEAACAGERLDEKASVHEHGWDGTDR